MAAPKVSRQGRRLGALVGAVAAAALLLVGLNGVGLIGRQGMAIGGGLLMLAMTPLSLPWWRAVGEPAREAHKSAFYWGGLTGFSLAGCAAMRAAVSAHTDLRPLSALWLAPGPQAAGVAAGALLTLLMITVCYAVAWSAGWLRRR